jgi:hypothetical protein
MTLGGWSRLGVVFTVLWLLGVAALVAVEYTSQKRDAGILVSWEQDKPKPWEIDWSKNPPLKGQVFDMDAYLRSQGMTQAQIDAMPFLPVWRWRRLLFVLFGVPVGAWLIAGAAIRATRWVQAGFRKSPS